jgi:hypothetical protein
MTSIVTLVCIAVLFFPLRLVSDRSDGEESQENDVPIVRLPSDCATAEEDSVNWKLINKCTFGVYWIARCPPAAAACYGSSTIQVSAGASRIWGPRSYMILEGPYK